MFKTIASALLAASLLAGCASAPTAPKAVPQTDFSADTLNAVAWTQTAIEHDLIYREVYRDATDHLLTALDIPHWDALAHDDRGEIPLDGLPPAVVLDIAETVLDNS
ncbi:MAG: acid phosphatase, partial [Xanthomonadales bacterium]|nr:acid phosphatase [Xanthomonadales bacterium]